MAEPLEIVYQGKRAAAALLDEKTGICSFQYAPEFVDTGIELSPIKMPLSNRIYSFSGLDRSAFNGMPGLLAGSLPDDFGNNVLNEWLARQGRSINSISPLERLNFTGQRGMGALEFRPAKERKEFNYQDNVDVLELIQVAQDVLDNRGQTVASLNQDSAENEEAMLALLAVGTSAGGARPKAVLSFNDSFTEVRSGQVDAPKGFSHYLMKFDGVTSNSDNQETFGDPLGYSSMEYVYYLMAKDCGIDMEECRLLDEGPRRHFLTKRFDRVGNDKIHFQTLFAINHISHKTTGYYSYAELFMLAKELKLPFSDASQLLKRMVFNIVARNHDDHSKNFGFILNDANEWRLSPAYDLAYSYKPGNKWINSHWMTLNGKREDFERKDFYWLENISDRFSRKIIDQVIDEVVEAVSKWNVLAGDNRVPAKLIKIIDSNLRITI